ncbi:hypothetical protein [Cytobacillus firmus]|uniref:hypothetical protein n=1 Tax=Cytobacillus firmus TaxID=1399 RepID=UPI00054F6562|nr:hypothetical protein [Cytobacillus firmus]
MIVDNKDDIKPSVELPSEFTARFSGETYIHSPVDFAFTNYGDNFTINFLHYTGVYQVLEFLSKGNDFDLTASVWGYDEMQVFERNKGNIFKEIELENAEKVLRNEEPEN